MTGRTIEGLLFDEARAFLSNLEKEQQENWWVWREDWAEWLPLMQVDTIIEPIQRSVQLLPPPLPGCAEEDILEIEGQNHQKTKPKTVGAGSTHLPPLPNLTHHSQSNETKFAQQTQHGSIVTHKQFIARAKKRFKKKFLVTIKGDEGAVFRTTTRDVSIGGIYFADSLPDWVVGYFKVKMSKPNSQQYVELTCCLIENQEAGKRYRVAIIPLQNKTDEKNLESWFAAS